MKKASDLTDLLIKPLDLGLKEINSLIQTFELTEEALISHQQSIHQIHENFINFDLTAENPLIELFSGLKSVFSVWSFGLFRLKNSLKLDILEPLRMFSENLRSHTKQFESDIGKAEDSLLLCTKRLSDCKSKYLKDAETLENMDTQRFGQSNPAKQNLQGAVSLQLVECLNAEKKLNESHETFEKVSIKLIESVKKNEESRMYFLKTSAEKFIHHYSSFIETMTQKLKETTENICRTSCLFKDEEFLAKLNEFIPPKLVFETYNSLKHKNRSVDMVEDSLIVNSTIELLVYKKSSEQASIERLIEIVETFEGQEWFFRVLEQKVSNKPIGHYEITKLGEIFIRILASLPKIERSYQIFAHIIRISEVIWTNHLNVKKFLYEFLVADQGLIDASRWSYLIQNETDERWKKEVVISSRMKKRAKSKGFFESIKKINFLSKDTFELKQEDIKRKILREVLVTYSYKLWKFKVDQDVSYGIIMNFAVQHSIDCECIADMLTIIRPAREYHKRKTMNKPIKNIKNFKVFLPYLTLRDQIELLKVSKAVNIELTRLVYKNFLMSPMKKTLKLRKSLWIQVLKPDFPAHSYNDMKKELKINKRTIEKQSKIIQLDVARSCSNIEVRKAVKKVLEVYAYFNKHVGYCQGMNFIVSTFYSITKNRELTYYCLYAFIKKLKMQVVLADNLVGLKCFLYQFDKLIELKIPKVYKIFMNTESFSCNFASSWFLTAFSGSFYDKLELLYEIWDLLFAKGWKIIFQVALIFVKIQQDDILDYYITENTVHLSSEKMVAKGAQLKNLGKYIREVKISKKHLDQLQQDYLKIIKDSRN